MAITKVSRGLLNTGVSDSSDATAITITSDEKVGIGVTTPENYTFGTPLAISAPSGANSGLTIVSATNSNGTIAMADGTSGSEAYKGYLQYSHASDAMFIGAGGSAIARFDAHGLKFGSDTAAANALDDYEEGTWTPTNADSGETANMGGDSARYTKIGNMVSLRFDITNTSGNHANLIGGLPYTVKFAAHGGIFIVYNNLSSGTSEYTTGYCNAGSTYIRLTVAGGVNSWQLNNGYRIIGFGVYETDS